MWAENVRWAGGRRRRQAQKASVAGQEAGNVFGEGAVSDLITHIDIVLKQLVRCLVVLQHVVICTTAGEGGSEQESEQSVSLFTSAHLFYFLRKHSWLTDPPRNAPRGFRAGNGTASADSRRALVWKLRVAHGAMFVDASARALVVNSREVILRAVWYDR